MSLFVVMGACTGPILPGPRGSDCVLSMVCAAAEGHFAKDWPPGRPLCWTQFQDWCCNTSCIGWNGGLSDPDLGKVA